MFKVLKCGMWDFIKDYVLMLVLMNIRNQEGIKKDKVLWKKKK